MTINLKVPDVRELRPRITVFGVGGAGGNAVNNMIRAGLQGVDFVVANTDAQALTMSSAERRIQMGTELTEGLGAGSHPEVGRSAAEEVIDEIQDQLAGAHMAFITAGMGGGTGTGAAPIVARCAREQGILTVGVVTKPFQFEGARRLRTAEAGIMEMQKHVDTLIVIPNQNLFRIANEKTTFADAFSMADQVLYSGVACITDLIVKEGLINLDFADVRAVMSEMGKAMMGTGEASGDKRAVEAAEAAISNPLLDDVSMRGAKGLLISITGGNDLTLYEVDEAATRIREEVDPDANIILGATFDDSLEGIVRVSVVATGIDAEESKAAREAERSNQAATIRSKAVPEAAPVSMTPARPAASEPAVPLHRPIEPPAPITFHEPELEEPQKVATVTGDGITLRPMKVEPVSLELPEPPRPIVEEPMNEPYIPPVAERVDLRSPRMPHINDFPIPAQNEIKAKSGEAPEMGIEAHKKKSGFFKRLASVGLGIREDEDAMDDIPVKAPQIARTDPPVAANAPRRPQPIMPAEQGVRTQRIAGPAQNDRNDDDHLEIPAFLRRQAN